MILLLGATGYIGQAFATELRRRGEMFVPLTRKALDYTNFDILFDYVRRAKPSFLINAAGYVGQPNIDACEIARTETLQGNVVLPQTVGRVCLLTDTPWAHVSSGCIYSGAKVLRNGAPQIERDLSVPALQQLFTTHPEHFYGFTEFDTPNFAFNALPCNFYSGTKALAEENLRALGPSYLWRIRIPFDELDHPRNFLSKIQNYPKVYNNINSFSHRGDFVRACLDLWERRAPMGIYNVTNPGAVNTRQVVEQLKKALKPARRFEFWKDDEEFYRCAAKTPRSNCILDSSKLLTAGVTMRPAQKAFQHSLEHWEAVRDTSPALVDFSNTITDVDFAVPFSEQISQSARQFPGLSR